MYIRKEAAKSSEIEGTKATIIDVIKKESTLEYKLPQDVDRIIHYIKAMEYGLKRLKKLSLSLGFIREIHKILLEDTVDAPIRKINKIPHISHFRIFFYQVEDTFGLKPPIFLILIIILIFYNNWMFPLLYFIKNKCF